VAAIGRDPEKVRMLPMAYTVVGETEAHAREKEDIFLNQLVDPMASLALLSELTNYDFARHDLDEEITDALLEKAGGIRGMVQGWQKANGGATMTLRQLASMRATLLQGPRFVGTGAQVAEQMHAWYDDGACDGFVIAATHTPGSYEEFVRMAVPELRKRGIFRTEYSGDTLRDHLGLERPTRMKP
jgi:alkanesulfonate monooxygenase SsuD/methylene tetrahydromethanopterin reductase-like flavin-dependent oxidoreductase (luciferase family)